MTEYSAGRDRRHHAHVKALRAMADWMEPYSTLPVADYLAEVVTADTVEALVIVASAHDLPGPHRAADGSYYLYKAFGAGVTWQAVHYNNPASASADELRARAWARNHGLILTPRIPGGLS